MAISIPQALELNAKQPIDTRLLLTKAKMLAMSDDNMPSKYFAMCMDDGKLYLYDKNNEVDPETGKFRLQDIEITPSKLAGELPEALKIALSQQDLDSGLAVDDDGNISVQLNDEHLKIIDNKIDLALELIQAIGPEV